MKKLLSSLLAFSLLFCVSACETQPDTPTNPQDEYVELLYDASFSRGFNLYGPDSRYHATSPWERFTLDSAADPFWKLASWGCFVNYYLDRALTVTEDGKTYSYPARPVSVTENGGAYALSNPSYTVKVNPRTGYLSLKLDSSAEYGVTPSYTDAPRISSPRKANEAWPHLLIEENIADPVTVAEMSELVFSLDFSVTEAECLMSDSQFDKSLHTAQITWFISVACINPASAFYNRYIWFGLPVYDYRYPVPSYNESAHFDGGKDDATGMLIYNPPRAEYLGEEIEIGERYAFSKDMLPKIARAFEIAKEKGVFTDCTLSDMRVVNTNIGWELPGTFSAAFEIYNMSIKYRSGD